LKSDELEDVAGKKPHPMHEDQVYEILKGNRFRFTLDNFEQYSAETRKIAERIFKRSEVNIERGVETIEQNLKEVEEPQYRSILLMRLFQVAIE